MLCIREHKHHAVTDSGRLCCQHLEDGKKGGVTISRQNTFTPIHQHTYMAYIPAYSSLHSFTARTFNISYISLVNLLPAYTDFVVFDLSVIYYHNFSPTKCFLISHSQTTVHTLFTGIFIIHQRLLSHCQ